MPPLSSLFISSVPAGKNLELLYRSGDLMAHNTTIVRGDQPPASAGEEALLPELPKESDLSWVERGWLSTFEDAKEQRDDPAGGELAVGLTGDMYYIAPETPEKFDDLFQRKEKLDDPPGKQLLDLLTMLVPDEQDSDADTPASGG